MDAFELYRNPHLAPFIGLAPDEQLDIGEVPETTAVMDTITGQPEPPLGVTNNMARFRADFPYVPVIPFPNQVRTVALVQNVPKDIQIPDRVVAILLRGSGNYYVSNNGNAEIPIAVMDNDSGSFTSRSIFKPEGFLLYTGGIKTLSVITPDVGGCVVTLMGYCPIEMPRYA